MEQENFDIQEEVVHQQEEHIEENQVNKQSEKKDQDWKRFRERQEVMEKELLEARKKAEEYERILMDKSKISEFSDEDVELSPDDIPEWKHVKKKFEKLEKELHGYQQRSSEAIIEARLKTQYPDFDAIVNVDSLNALKTAYPELAATINSSNDLYSKATSAYTIIKNMGFSSVSSGEYDNEKEMVLRNRAKPRPMASVNPQEGMSPLTKANAFANGLTDELKSQLYREMLASRRRN